MSFLLKINLYHGLTVKVNRIINDSMNKMKEIWKEIKGVYPPSLWVANIGLVTIALLVILFV